MGRLCKGRTAEQNEGRGEIKPFSCFHWPVLLTARISKVLLFVLDAPKHRVGSHQTAGGLPAPRGISPLAWFSRDRPHCLRRITAAGRFNARTLGWTGVSLSPLLVMAVPGAIRYWQPAVSRSLPGRTNQRPAFSFFGGVSLFSSGRSPRSSRLGFGFRQSSGNVLDEWVCSFQGAVRP